MSLSELIADQAASIQDISHYLDGLTVDARRNEIGVLKSKEVKELYSRAASAEPLTLDYFVPERVPTGQPIPHIGRNSLPAFNDFQKIMVRGEGENGAIFGYNEQALKWFTGPGYFICREVLREEWMSRGAVVIDYFVVPGDDVKLPEGWPTVVSNGHMFSYFVYHKTRDFMRRVSSHVSVGAAYKNEQDKEMGAYFVLCREDP